MFFGLGHGAVSTGDDEDSAVHLSGTGNHVFDIISVTGAINMSIVTIFSFVFNGSGIDGNSTSALFRSGVNFIVFFGGTVTHGSEGHGKSSGESSFAMVDMTDSADVKMGLVTLELTASSADGEGRVGGGRTVTARRGSEVEDCGGVEE